MYLQILRSEAADCLIGKSGVEAAVLPLVAHSAAGASSSTHYAESAQKTHCFQKQTCYRAVWLVDEAFGPEDLLLLKAFAIATSRSV
jgi:hypothetical protein